MKFSCFLGFTKYENVNFEGENSNFLIFCEKVSIKGIYDGHLICIVKSIVVISSRTGLKNARLTQQYQKVKKTVKSSFLALASFSVTKRT